MQGQWACALRVHGLTLHGATWDAGVGGLCELPHDAVVPMPEAIASRALPSVWLVQEAQLPSPNSGVAEVTAPTAKIVASSALGAPFATPLYKTPNRLERLVYVNLPNPLCDSKRWTLRGVALTLV